VSYHFEEHVLEVHFWNSFLEAFILVGFPLLVAWGGYNAKISDPNNAKICAVHAQLSICPSCNRKLTCLHANHSSVLEMHSHGNPHQNFTPHLKHRDTNKSSLTEPWHARSQNAFQDGRC
jgi:hypothetical protein